VVRDSLIIIHFTHLHHARCSCKCTLYISVVAGSAEQQQTVPRCPSDLESEIGQHRHYVSMLLNSGHSAMCGTHQQRYLHVSRNILTMCAKRAALSGTLAPVPRVVPRRSHVTSWGKLASHVIRSQQGRQGLAKVIVTHGAMESESCSNFCSLLHQRLMGWQHLAIIVVHPSCGAIVRPYLPEDASEKQLAENSHGDEHAQLAVVLAAYGARCVLQQ
jgi:hypothetical protein